MFRKAANLDLGTNTSPVIDLLQKLFNFRFVETMTVYFGKSNQVH